MNIGGPRSLDAPKKRYGHTMTVILVALVVKHREDMLFGLSYFTFLFWPGGAVSVGNIYCCCTRRSEWRSKKPWQYPVGEDRARQGLYLEDRRTHAPSGVIPKAGYERIWGDMVRSSERLPIMGIHLNCPESLRKPRAAMA